MGSTSSSTIHPNSSAAQVRVTLQIKPFDSSLQKVSAAGFVFQLAIIFYSIAYCITLSELSYISAFSMAVSLLRYCTIGFLLLKILLFSKYSIREIVISLIFFAIALLGTYYYGNSQLLYLVLFVIGAREINVRNICRTVLPIIAICGVTIILLSLAGIIGNRTGYHINAITGEEDLRQAYGFTHVNNIGQLSLIAFACYLYLRYKNFGILDIGFTLIWAAWLFFAIASKTAPILMAIAAVLVLLSKITPKRGFIIICAIIGCIGILISFLLTYFYDPNNAFMSQINTWLSGRLRSAHYFFENFSITLFGQSIDFGEVGTSSRLILDNAYVSLLFRYGIFNLIAILMAYIFAFIKAAKNNVIPAIIVLTMLVLAGFAETWFYTLAGIIALVIGFGKHPNETSKGQLAYDAHNVQNNTLNI